MNHRRTFLKDITQGVALVAVSAFAVSVQSKAQAAGPVQVEENDPQAKTFSYVTDTAKVDQVKFPKHTVAQKCNSCQLYKGKLDDVLGGCQLFPVKPVAGIGWCSAYVKKA